MTDEIRLQTREELAADEPQKPVMQQRWSDLLFLHWMIDAEVIAQTLPDALSVDVDRDGHAWIGLVPFAMSRIRPRGLPALPWLSAFLEMNVRTYVVDDKGRPGVYFYSLDAARWIAVKFARKAFRLPYFHAEMSQSVDPETGWVNYECRRFGDPSLYLKDKFHPEGQFANQSTFRYRANSSALIPAELGSLEFFLLERYLLFTPGSHNSIRSGRVRHTPYQFTQDVELAHWSPLALLQAGFDTPGRDPDHVAWAAPVDVNVFALQ